MNEEKIGMYSVNEIYEELANGFLHRSMVDAMYFKIKELNNINDKLGNALNSAEEKLDAIKFYIEQSDIKNMLWGKEILKIIGGNDDSTRNV
jgi:hypothetical protein